MADDVKEQPENPVIHGMLLFPGTTKEQIDTFPRLIARENDIFINTYMKAGKTKITTGANFGGFFGSRCTQKIL